MDLHSDEKRESVSFSRKSLVIGIVGITFALIFACYITFYFTKVNYDKSVIVRIAAVTQMEPTYARRMVPCFDEPEYKANWTVTVIHPTGTTALSNGFEKESSKLGDHWTISKFETTPKMSSYLLAIIVSEFHFNEMNTTSGVRFRVWSRPEAMNLTKYALEAGVKCLEYYEKYFGIKYPLKKQGEINMYVNNHEEDGYK
uniref:Peptidase_M1_N domain-containing protein n=1 Tax=Heterorhabditis bacteriophora TaxID=37862 RepID=A0A1I7XLI4_HETBA